MWHAGCTVPKMSNQQDDIRNAIRRRTSHIGASLPWKHPAIVRYSTGAHQHGKTSLISPRAMTIGGRCRTFAAFLCVGYCTIFCGAVTENLILRRVSINLRYSLASAGDGTCLPCPLKSQAWCLSKTKYSTLFTDGRFVVSKAQLCRAG